MKVSLICIGDELLSGQTTNSNLTFAGNTLAAMGIPITFSAVVMDNREEIIEILRYTSETSDIVITVGGLGPTCDDLTRESVASFFGKKLLLNFKLWQSIKERFSRRGLIAPPSNKCQAQIPEDFHVIPNRLGTAPGLLYEFDTKTMILLPGVPHEMKSMLTEMVLPFLIKKYGAVTSGFKSVKTIGTPESFLSELVKQADLPNSVKVAFLPKPGRVDLRLTGNNIEMVNTAFQTIVGIVGKLAWGFDNEMIEEKIKTAFVKRAKTLSLAESCTGGFVQKLITDVPGASTFFRGGVVSYSNDIKEKLLGVSTETIKKNGAVSKQTCSEMSRGVKTLFESDISASVSGLAGPDGGSQDKPVGTVWFSVLSEKGELLKKQVFSGNRLTIRESAAYFLLNMILEVITAD